MRLAAEILLAHLPLLQAWLSLVNRSQVTEAGYTGVCSPFDGQATVEEHLVRMKCCWGARHTDLLCMFTRTERINFPPLQPEAPPFSRHQTKELHGWDLSLWNDHIILRWLSVWVHSHSNCERECSQRLKEHTPSFAFLLTRIQNVLPNDPKTSSR